MSGQVVEYETVWTGEMETAAAKAQQLTEAPAARRFVRRTDHEVVVSWMRRHPWSTMRAIHTATGVSLPNVNDTLQLHLRNGQLQRSHRQDDDRSQAVRWAVAE